jgi:hypothetical protein
VSRVGILSRFVLVAGLGLFLGGCGDLGDAIDGSLTKRDCYSDPRTVSALRREPVLTQTPPGATPTAVTETVSCGWNSSKLWNLGKLDREITGTGAAGDVSRFYADLARSSGWMVSDGVHVLDAWKPDGTDCTWGLQVLSTANGIYHVQVTYTPRDVRPSCL